MSTLFTILRAAHCRSTHHYFALDALDYVETEAGKRFADLLLKYHDDYLVGAKAPDSSFRDFKNHVLHVADDYWGGAIGACEDWLEETILLLNERKWKRAAYACGVLSHYFTDPLMPLHTGSCERESLVHRPMEWSICKSYNSIFEASKQRTDTRFEIPDRGKWMASALTNGA
ncbi:MAG: zinc dependent phospholipase C family protein, partial [Planctomycetota bacterium]